MDIAKGKYERTSEEKYDECLKALGLNAVLRKAATASTPIMEITEKDGQWKIKSSTIMKTIELKFKVGEIFEETTPDGRLVSSIVTIEDGNKFVCIQTAKKEGQKSTKTIREFNKDGCIMTMEIIGTDVACVQKFKRLS